MLEPGLRESDIGPRNRLHHSAAPTAIDRSHTRSFALGVKQSCQSGSRECAASSRFRLSIYLEAGDKDFLNARDGTEFLHRVLWDLDLSHEYHLVRGADHGGPTMRPRLCAMFTWFGSPWSPAPLNAAAEQTATAWLQSGMRGKPPAGATTTNASFVPGSNRSGQRPRRATPPQTAPSATSEKDSFFLRLYKTDG